MAKPTRYPSGVSTQYSRQTLGNLPFPDPTKVYMHFDDFSVYRAADWTVATGVNAGAVASVAGQGGLIALTTAAVTAADFETIVATPLDFNFVAGQEVWYSTYLKLSEITASIALAGYVGSAPGATLTPTSGIYFRKAAATATVDLVVRLASTSTTLSAVTTLVANTYVKLGFYYNGKDQITAYINDVEAGSQVILTNLPVATPLSHSFGVVSGETVVKTLTADWVLSSQARTLP